MWKNNEIWNALTTNIKDKQWRNFFPEYLRQTIKKFVFPEYLRQTMKFFPEFLRQTIKKFFSWIFKTIKKLFPIYL